MTNEERDLITQFITRVSGQQQGQASFGGSVPATATPPLPPVDPEADRLIADLFRRYPTAPYRMTQLAFVQEHALTEAQNRIQRLEWELQQAQQAAQQSRQQQSGPGGFFSGLFGGGSRASAPPPPQGGPGPAWNQGQPNYQQAPPPPQYPPSYQPGMFQRQGSGFLGSALTTAAGVAGGVVAGNALMSLFSGGHGFGGGFGSGFGGGNTTIVEENSPWGGASQQGYVDQGTWTDPGALPGGDPGAVDSGTWDTSGGDQSSWTDNSGGDPGWDTSGGSGSDDDTF